MPHYVVDRLAEALDRKLGQGLAAARILIVGIAYKKNVDDMRESPSLKLIELIEARGAQADYLDPYVPEIPMTREHASLAGRRSVELRAATLSDYDAVLVATDHDNVDYRLIVESGKVVVDTRNVFLRAGLDSSGIVKA